MNQSKIPDFSNRKKCISCGKQATKLCDIVTGVASWAGHPPRKNGVFTDQLGEVPMQWNLTCDKPICDKCAVSLNEYMDICPDGHIEIEDSKGMETDVFKIKRKLLEAKYDLILKIV